MTVFVGSDSAGTRATLTAGGSTVAYYSIPAAEKAGHAESAATLGIVGLVVGKGDDQHWPARLQSLAGRANSRLMDDGRGMRKQR